MPELHPLRVFPNQSRGVAVESDCQRFSSDALGCASQASAAASVQIEYRWKQRPKRTGAQDAVHNEAGYIHSTAHCRETHPCRCRRKFSNVGDRRGDELPEELLTREGRRKVLAEAKRRLIERRAKEEPASQQARARDEASGHRVGRTGRTLAVLLSRRRLRGILMARRYGATATVLWVAASTTSVVTTCPNSSCSVAITAR